MAVSSPRKVPAQSRLHYAWVILAAAAVLSIASRADSASFAVFVDPLVKLHGWSRGQVSLAYSLAFLGGIPAVLVVGWLGDRYGARRPLVAAALVMALGTVLMGTIAHLWQLYLFYGLLVGSLGNASFVVLLPVTITRWFHRRAGLAIAIYWASVGMGPVVFAPVFRWLIESQGWRWTFVTMGLVLGAALFFCSLLIRGRPREKGMTAYGADNSPNTPPGQEALGLAQGLRTVMARPSVWHLTTIHHLGCVGHAVILAHVVSMATYQGVSGVAAAGVISVIAGTSVFSRFLFSLLTERLGARRLLATALILQSTPILLLLWAREPWAFYLFAVAFGLGYGGEMVGFPIINRQLYGPEAPLSSIYSFQTLGAMLGMALGGWLGGALFDLSGAYRWSILLAAGVGLLAMPSVLSLPRQREAAFPPGRVVATAPQ
ncbi:MAG: MFS transporter [Chloroflexi bacterium]|nr:MFS transporter [Chloroflexota bacterium]